MFKRSENPEWLEKLQSNSWQIEMLIAGGVVYTLYQLPSFFQQYFIIAYESIGLTDYLVFYLLGAYMLTRLLLIGFTINLLLRSIWVAYIGIYASFPNGINENHPKDGDWYRQKKSKQLSVRAILDRLEMACNTTYSLSILLCLISVSVLLLMLIIATLISKIPFYSFLDTAAFKYSLVLIFMLFVLGTFERLMHRLLINRPNALKWSRRLFKLMDYLSLAFLYKGAWLTLSSNIKTWKIQTLVLLYFGVGLLLSINQIGDYLNSNGFFNYDPMEERDFLNIPIANEVKFNNYFNTLPEKNSFALEGCISSDIVRDRYMWVFVPYWNSMDKSLKRHFQKYQVPLNNSSLDTLKQENYWAKKLYTDSLHKVALADFFTVIIDQDTLKDLRWFEHQLPKTTERGFIAYIDTDSIAASEHLLQLRWTDYNWRGKEYETNWLNIPFWKE
ncbi:MAG: hypothetical protein Sapg2KO_15420 [Saprospiraceae bacterium]